MLDITVGQPPDLLHRILVRRQVITALHLQQLLHSILAMLAIIAPQLLRQLLLLSRYSALLAIIAQTVRRKYNVPKQIQGVYIFAPLAHHLLDKHSAK